MIRSGLRPLNASAGSGTQKDARREGAETGGSVNNAAVTDTQQGAIVSGSPAKLPEGAVLPAVGGVVPSVIARACSPERQCTIAASSKEPDDEPSRSAKTHATTGASRQTTYSAANQVAKTGRSARAANDSMFNSASDERNHTLRLSLRFWSA